MITETHPKRMEIEEILDAYFVINEVSGLTETFKYKPMMECISTNSFNHRYNIKMYTGGGFNNTPQMRTVVSIKHNMLTKRIIAEIDERIFGLNTSRYAPLKNYKREVKLDGKQGQRIIWVTINNPEHLQQFLIDIQPVMYDCER